MEQIPPEVKLYIEKHLYNSYKAHLHKFGQDSLIGNLIKEKIGMAEFERKCEKLGI